MSTPAEIIETVTRFQNAFEPNDVDTLMSCMTEDTVFEHIAPEGVSFGRYEGHDAVRAVWPDDLPLASGLSALGMTGLCAWLGLSQIGQPIPEDTVVVSGASGAIGSLAGQIASLYGTRVIGTARGADKCQFVSELGFDAAIDQSQTDWPAQLAQLAPNGVDVFFDNVGGEVLDTLLTQMNPSGRIVVCGATAHYSPGASISNHMMLAVTGCTMKGFFYFDYQPYWAQARQRMAQLLSRGAIQDPLDITEGFDRVPQAALGQFQSANFGRKLIQVN